MVDGVGETGKPKNRNESPRIVLHKSGTCLSCENQPMTGWFVSQHSHCKIVLIYEYRRREMKNLHLDSSERHFCDDQSTSYTLHFTISSHDNNWLVTIWEEEMATEESLRRVLNLWGRPSSWESKCTLHTSRHTQNKCARFKQLNL